jgi:hypothetical protein
MLRLGRRLQAPITHRYSAVGTPIGPLSMRPKGQVGEGGPPSPLEVSREEHSAGEEEMQKIRGSKERREADGGRPRRGP